MIAPRNMALTTNQSVTNIMSSFVRNNEKVDENILSMWKTEHSRHLRFGNSYVCPSDTSTGITRI